MLLSGWWGKFIFTVNRNLWCHNIDGLIAHKHSTLEQGFVWLEIKSQRPLRSGVFGLMVFAAVMRVRSPLFSTVHDAKRFSSLARCSLGGHEPADSFGGHEPGRDIQIQVIILFAYGGFRNNNKQQLYWK